MSDSFEPQTRAAAEADAPRWVALCCALACFAMSLAFWYPSVEFEWMGFDDEILIVQNDQIFLGLTPAGFKWAFTTGYVANWFPLTWLSWMADYHFFGLEAGPFHRTNVVLHALVAAFLLLAVWRLTGALWRSAFVAGVFALHPLHVESVAWISERKGLLAGLFFALALLAYAEYAKNPARLRYFLLVSLAMALGLMTKPVLVTLPFVLLLLDLWPLQRLRGEEGSGWLDVSRLRDCAQEKLPLFGLAAVSSYITFQAQNASGAVATTAALPVLGRIQGALLGYARYLEETFWPNELAVFYPIREISWLDTSLAALLLLAITSAAWLSRRQRPYLLVGWLWFVGMLVPTIGLVQVGAQAVADRYTYLPMIGLSIGVTWAFADALPRTRAARSASVALAVVLLAGLGCAAAAQLEHWRDTMSLMRHTLAVTGDNPRIERKLAETLYHLGRIDEARGHLDHALSLSPNDPMIHVTLGGLELSEKNVAKAAKAYLRALTLDPSQWLAHQSLGEIRSEQQRFEEACAHFELGVRATNGNRIRLVSQLGICLVEAGRFDQALPWLEQAMRQSEAHGLSMEALAPYAKLVAAARNGDPESLRGADVGSPGLLQAKAELFVRAKRPQAAIRELQTALQLVEILDYPESTRSAIEKRIEELDTDADFFRPGGAFP